MAQVISLDTRDVQFLLRYNANTIGIALSLLPRHCIDREL